MGDINKWCVMCGAAPGEPCTIISGDPEAGENPGHVRREPHFYRHSDEKPTVLVPDEPPFYVGNPKPGGGTYTREDALAWAADNQAKRKIASPQSAIDQKRVREAERTELVWKYGRSSEADNDA